MNVSAPTSSTSPSARPCLPSRCFHLSLPERPPGSYSITFGSRQALGAPRRLVSTIKHSLIMTTNFFLTSLPEPLRRLSCLIISKLPCPGSAINGIVDPDSSMRHTAPRYQTISSPPCFGTKQCTRNVVKCERIGISRNIMDVWLSHMFSSCQLDWSMLTWLATTYIHPHSLTYVGTDLAFYWLYFRCTMIAELA